MHFTTLKDTAQVNKIYKTTFKQNETQTIAILYFLIVITHLNDLNLKVEGYKGTTE